jgi:hypothetical protein
MSTIFRNGLENKSESSGTKVTNIKRTLRVYWWGFPQQDRAQWIVRAVSEHALHATVSPMLKAFLPQPVVVADGAELLDGEISQYSYAAEFVRNFSGFLLLTFTWHTRRFERLRSELRFENCGLSCG